MKSALKRLYARTTAALIASRSVGAVVGVQHRNLPLPVSVFALLFRTRTMARLLAWYGHHVFWTDYGPRASNEEYWTGDRSVYWHLYRGHDFDEDLLSGLPEWPAALAALQSARVICEPGFGLGKMTQALISADILRPEKIIGLEPSDCVRKFAGKRHVGHPIIPVPGGMDTLADHSFDTLLVTGGVLMCYPPDDLKRHISALPASCKRIIVIGEGATRTIRRDDETYMHALPDLARQVGMNATFEAMKENGQYSVFIAE